jgi:hypothetical protein
MKKLSLLAVIIITYFACSKTQNSTSKSNPQDKSLIEEARTFFLNDSRTNASTGQVSVNNNSTVRPDLLRNFNKRANWNQANVLNMPNRGPVVVVPIQFEGNISARPSFDNNSVRIPANSLASLVVFKDSANNLHALVASYYGDSAYLFGKPGDKFTGVALIQDWSGNFVRGFKLTRDSIYNINLQDSSTQQSDSVQTNIAKPPDGEYTIETCTYMDYYTCFSTADQAMECNPSPSFSVKIGCSYEFFGIDYGSTTTLRTSDISYMTSAGGGPIATKTIVDSIYNQLTNMCLTKVLDHLRFDNIKSNLYAMFYKEFANSEEFDAYFQQVASVPDINEDAHTTPVLKGQFLDVQIQLSMQRLSNASQEFIAETMYHEIIHAYLDANTGLYNEMNQHVYMFTNLIDDEVNSVRAAYPGLSTHDYYCIVIAGYGDIQANYPTLFNAALTRYNLTSDDCRLTAESYRLGGLGTKCSSPVPGPAE